jgi:Zn-dependent peptidase ImmA (M78 family)
MKSAVDSHREPLHPRFDLASAAAAAALARIRGAAEHLSVPVPIDRIAGALGYRIILLYDVPEEISGLVSARDRLIGVNGCHHPHRRRFTVGHELGHVLLGHPPESRCSHERIRMYDLEADRCASDLLIPRYLLDPFLRKNVPLSDLARIFDVSQEAMTLKLGWIGQPFRAPLAGL